MTRIQGAAICIAVYSAVLFTLALITWTYGTIRGRSSTFTEQSVSTMVGAGASGIIASFMLMSQI